MSIGNCLDFNLTVSLGACERADQLLIHEEVSAGAGAVTRA